jgi:hypothetical protein
MDATMMKFPLLLVGGRISPLTYPPRQALNAGVLNESLSGDEEDDSKANILLAQAASAKCASSHEMDEDLRIPNDNELSTIWAGT